MYFVYLLISTSGCTYVGATTDLNRRLRQHNMEIKGGARSTTLKVLQGETWSRVCYITNFPDWSSALQFEWRFKQLSKKISHKLNPLERRKLALSQLLSLDKPTSNSKLFNEWKTPPQIIWENIQIL